jgi:DNA repair protein RadC
MQVEIHSGHRARVKQRFLRSGLDSFDDHQVLELLLFYAIPQRDVNELAHALLNHFGSLSAVFDAPEQELQQVPGIGENAAVLIKLLPQIGRRYLISKEADSGVIQTSAQAGRFLLPRFFAERDETVYLLCLDVKNKVLGCQCLFRGSINSAQISTRKIVEAALKYNASCVILAHNHPSGMALPSEEDYRTTERISAALRAVGIELRDHIVVADRDFVSMADSGVFRR